jgi:D-serine deaminase-like pyridoxal phosphate-dependent protein
MRQDIDRAAVGRLRDERIDWRFKGLPAPVFGQTVGEVAEARLDLFTGGFVGPLVVLDAEALEHNLRTMAAWCAAHGIALAPHGKTTMAPQLFERQLDHGAWGMTSANVSQLRVYRAFGVRRIVLANQLVDPAGLSWVASELERDPDFEFSCWVDSPEVVARMSDALGTTSRPVDVILELGGSNGRTGARDIPAALAVADAVAATPALRLIGTGGYEAALAQGSLAEKFAAVDRYLRDLRTLTLRLAEQGRFADGQPILVTAGGSAYFDQVTEILGQPWPIPVQPLLRSGAYVTHDDGYYRAIAPFTRTGDTPLRPALRAWAQVSSRPEPGLALLTLGKRDASFDEGFPEPQLIRHSDGTIEPLPGCTVRKLNDQHAFLVLGDAEVHVGEWVGLGLSHPCTVFDKWPLIPVVEGTTVVDLVRTFF